MNALSFQNAAMSNPRNRLHPHDHNLTILHPKTSFDFGFDVCLWAGC